MALTTSGGFARSRAREAERIDFAAANRQADSGLKTNSHVRVGVFGSAVWARVEGRGSFQTSGGLKRYASDMIARGFRQFVVDLHGCDSMDSTFMGTLAGIALRLREAGGGDLQVVRANERNTFLLENLGLDRLFAVKPEGDADTPAVPQENALETTRQEPAHTGEVLAAHEALVQADPDNAPRFRDVMDYLARESGGEARS